MTQFNVITRVGARRCQVSDTARYQTLRQAFDLKCQCYRRAHICLWQ